LLRADSVTYLHDRGGAREGAAPLLLPDDGRLARPGVQGVTVRVERGHVVGILGPNGSGKTTLLRLLAGMLRPESGTVTLNGRDLASLARPALARSIAVVPQETHLAFDYSVLEIALMGRYPHLGTFELEGPRDLAIAREALAATGTLALERRSFATLSGGEKQRVVIASALAQQAEILLLDEPTASLDLGYQFDVAALLARLNREPLPFHRHALRGPRRRRRADRRHAHQHVDPGALRSGCGCLSPPCRGPSHRGAAQEGAA
jgi:ABC-type Mn2+/Zn2+ transport system ATPase subunit